MTANSNSNSNLHRIAARLSPRHRAWDRLLESLTLDPETLPDPVPAPEGRDFLMCGSPRSGTALLVAMLFQPPSVVTVMEPWDALRMPPRELFDSLRQEVLQTGSLARGRLDVEELYRDGSVTWCRDGERPHQLGEVDADFSLGVKFPAFWRYLDRLPDTRFLVCVRHPVEVIRSYRLTGGRLGLGLDYEVPFNREMNQHLLTEAEDPARRRVMLYDYVYERVLPRLQRPNVCVVRYERWFTDPEGQLAEIGEFLGVTLRPGTVRLRQPRSRNVDDADELAMIRRHCTTAAALGYEL